jgi:hypothetical protein
VPLILIRNSIGVCNATYYCLFNGCFCWVTQTRKSRIKHSAFNMTLSRHETGYKLAGVARRVIIFIGRSGKSHVPNPSKKQSLTTAPPPIRPHAAVVSGPSSCGGSTEHLPPGEDEPPRVVGVGPARDPWIRAQLLLHGCHRQDEQRQGGARIDPLRPPTASLLRGASNQ